MSRIINEVSTYCKEILISGKCASLPFHNLTHTMEVVDAVKKISEKEGISADEREILVIAAWFHDNGFPAEVIPLKNWKNGWKPNTILQH